jgi:hypothetical protein
VATSIELLMSLNLSDTVREFGSLRNYFEGKYLGERFVQEVKDAHQHCSHQNGEEATPG